MDIKTHQIIIALVIGIMLLCGCSSGPETTTTTQETTTTQSQLKQCGTSDSLANMNSQTQPDLEQDQAMVCFGEAILNDCEKAQMQTTQASNLPPMQASLKKENQECLVHVEFQQPEGNTSEMNQLLAGKWLECPAPMAQLEQSAQEGNIVLEDNPGKVAGNVLIYTIFSASNPQGNCTGTAIEAMQQQR